MSRLKYRVRGCLRACVCVPACVHARGHVRACVCVRACACACVCMMCVWRGRAWRGVIKKAFHGGQTFWGKYMEGVVLHGEMIRSCQGGRSITNAFSNNLDTLNLKIFATHGGKIKPSPVYRIIEEFIHLSLKLIVVMS